MTHTTFHLIAIPLFAISAVLGCGSEEKSEKKPPVIVINDNNEEDAGSTICGDGVVTGDEVCDDGINDGLAGGCLEDCSGVATTTCGNGMIDDGESCDGSVGLVSCTEIGFDEGGTSECTSSCQLNLSKCDGRRRLPSVAGAPIGVSPDNRYEIYTKICDGCYNVLGVPGAVHTLDLILGDVISHGEEFSTISYRPIDAERFWIIANWNRDEQFGQLQIRRFDGRGDPVAVADRVVLDGFGTHPTHQLFWDADKVAWIVEHGADVPKKIFDENLTAPILLGHDGTTALVELYNRLIWLNLDGSRVDFDSELSAFSPDRRWAVIESFSPSKHSVVSMADGSVLRSDLENLEYAQFSPSSNYLHITEVACNYLERTRLISLPSGAITTVGECASYTTSSRFDWITVDDRWLVQSRYLEAEARFETVFTDLDTRETTIIPYRFDAEDQQPPKYGYRPVSEQVLFTGFHANGSDASAHRLDLKTGELHPLPEGFAGGSVVDDGWLIGITADDPNTLTWDRYFLAVDGSMELFLRRIDWTMPIDTVPGLYIVKPADQSDSFYYARRGEADMELLYEDGYNTIRTYGPYLLWRDDNGTWLTIPK